MIELRDLSYIRMGTRDLDGAETYAKEILGFQPIRRDNGQLYLRTSYRDHSVCYFEGDPGDHAVGIELKDWYGLDDAMAYLNGQGIACTRGTAEETADRHVMDMAWFKDPTGNRIELVTRPEDANRRYFPTRDAGVLGLGHIGLFPALLHQFPGPQSAGLSPAGWFCIIPRIHGTDYASVSPICLAIHSRISKRPWAAKAGPCLWRPTTTVVLRIL